MLSSLTRPADTDSNNKPSIAHGSAGDQLSEIYERIKGGTKHESVEAEFHVEKSESSGSE